MAQRNKLQHIRLWIYRKYLSVSFVYNQRISPNLFFKLVNFSKNCASGDYISRGPLMAKKRTNLPVSVHFYPNKKQTPAVHAASVWLKAFETRLCYWWITFCCTIVAFHKYITVYDKASASEDRWCECAAPTSLRCDSPGGEYSKDHTRRAGLPLRSAGCTLAVGWCSLAPHKLFLEEQGLAPPLAHTLLAGRRNTKSTVCLHVCSCVCIHFLCGKAERVRSKNKYMLYLCSQ